MNPITPVVELLGRPEPRIYGRLFGLGRGGVWDSTGANPVADIQRLLAGLEAQAFALASDPLIFGDEDTGQSMARAIQAEYARLRREQMRL